MYWQCNLMVMLLNSILVAPVLSVVHAASEHAMNVTPVNDKLFASGIFKSANFL